ncbi:pyridoxal-phosphate dependent enzyme [Streptosporangium carneum]|nr:pyridoxal-phosphate dependent enzyme [Streptosporangium carneum]
MLSENVINAIGGTPLVRLRTGRERGVEVYAKLEMQNLFAMKDRVAKEIILQARARGELAEGAPVVESSSGTMALGVALVGTALGHPVHIVTDPRIDPITLAKLKALGCSVHVVKEMDERGWQGARLTRLAELMNEHPGAFWPRQYDNPDNPGAYRTLAAELLADLDRVDVVVGSVGSGGSLCGTSRVLKESLPDLRVVGVDCVGSVIFGQPDWPQRLQSGLGNSLRPPNVDHDLIDEVHWLSDHEAFSSTRELASEEKLFAGNTSGSVYRVLGELARRAEPGTRIVGIFPDRGDRYTATVHDDDYWAERNLSERPLSARPRQVVMGTPVSAWSYAHTREEDPRPRFVFVESNTTGTGMLALGVARRLGYEPLLLTADPGRYAGFEETGCQAVRCDTDDLDDLLGALGRACDPHTVAGVTTTSEFYLATAARLAGALGLAAEDPEAVAGCRDKGRLRRTLAEAGVRQPAFEVVRDPGDAARAALRVGLPCVVKPVDDSGSSRVRRCDTPEEAAAQVAEIVAVTVNGRGQPTARAALVEEYLDCPEYSVETFGLDGEHLLVGIVDKSVTGAPCFVESRHLVPAGLPADAAQEMAATVRAALSAAGLRRGPGHTEVKLTPEGAAIVEINPRLAGGMIPELFRLTTGVDLLESQIRYAAGFVPALPEGFDGCAGIRFLMPDGEGLLERVTGVDDARAVTGIERVTVTAIPGQAVRPPRDAYGRIGHVIARGRSREDVADALEKACGMIRVEVAESGGR